MKKTLPFNLDCAIQSECWVFYRLGIIQAYPLGDEWVYSHMGIFMDDSCYTMFGDNMNHHPLMYYEDTLQFEEIDIFTLSPAVLVQTIIKEIQNDNYIILDLLNGGGGVHETILYGYDKEENVFYYPQLHNNFITSKVSFSDIERQYSDMQAYFNENQRLKVNRPILYNFPITRVTLRNATPSDTVFSKILLKITREHDGLILECSTHNNDLGRKFTGIACLLGLQESITNYLKNNNAKINMHKITQSLKKLHENRCIILSSMKWISERNGFTDRCIIESIHTYEVCCSQIQKMLNMSIKSTYTHDKSLLLRIQQEISEIFTNEYNALDLFLKVFI